MKTAEILRVFIGLGVFAMQARASVTVVVRDDASGKFGVALVRVGNGIMVDEIERQFAHVPDSGKAGYAVSTEGFDDADSARIEKQFVETVAPLEERLLAALRVCADIDGFGDQPYSCALVVRSDASPEEDIEFGADGSQLSIEELGRLLAVRRAGSAIAAAERAWKDGNATETGRLIADVIALGESSDEVWRGAARLVLGMGDPDRCIQFLSMFAALNNPGAQVELREPIYDPLRERQDFRFVEDSLVYRAEIVP